MINSLSAKRKPRPYRKPFSTVPAICPASHLIHPSELSLFYLHVLLII
jgi:hypothetical protein